MINEKARVAIDNIVPTRIMTVLPPKEGFSPQEVGAIGLLVHRLAQRGDWVVGSVLKNTVFPDIHYLGVHSGWLSKLHKGKGYARGVASFVKRYQPLLIEVHNRPELALYLVRYFPSIKIVLVLHNDPLGMRFAKTVKQREKLCRNIHVVTVSNWLKQRFLSGNKKEIMQEQITCLPNSINLTQIPPYIPVKQRKRLILFVGRVVEDKGVDLFVHLCKLLSKQEADWQMEIIGADRFSYISKETDFIKDMKKQIAHTNIVMLGYLSHDQVLAKMAKATMIILPSRWHEPFGMTALEAMACGTPLVVSDRGALPEVVEDGAVIINPDNMDQAYEIVSQLLIDQAMQEKMSLRARNRSLFFDSDRALIRLNQFRKQICPDLPFPFS